MKKPEFINSGLDGVPEISIKGMIDDYEHGSIVALIDACGSKRMRMNINSLGGSVSVGQEIIASMQQYKDSGGVIETVNRGVAYSTAGWIFAAGTKGERKIMPFASIMTHPPMFADGKTLSDFMPGSEQHNILMDAMDKLIDIFVPITGRTKRAIRNFMINTTTFDAKRAVKEGFADEVVKISNQVVLKNELKPEEIMNVCEGVSYDIVNNEPEGDNNKNQVKMKELAKLLNLNPEASEKACVEAVTALINRADKAEADNKATAKTLDDTKAELQDVRNELKEVKEAEIINYVENYIGEDKEREAKRDELVNLATSDFETFKAICEVKPVVNAGARIDEGIEEEQKGGEDSSELKDAKEFFNMSIDERQKLKNSDVSKYNKLVNAYEKNTDKLF